MTTRRINAGEALAGAFAADDEAMPRRDYPLRLDSAQRMIASGVAASVATRLYGIDQDKPYVPRNVGLNQMEIAPLTRNTALRLAPELLALHNLIQYQHWNAAELLADADANRPFVRKWDLSFIAIEGKAPIAMSVSFQRGPLFQGLCDIYLHRLVVVAHRRRQKIGKSMVFRTCEAALQAGLSPETPLRAQTPRETHDTPSHYFYRSLGFVESGSKTYSDRVDSIYESSLFDVIAHNWPRYGVHR